MFTPAPTPLKTATALSEAHQEHSVLTFRELRLLIPGLFSLSILLEFSLPGGFEGDMFAARVAVGVTLG